MTNSADVKELEKILKYCDEHGLSSKYFYAVINEPKVVPMVRGIGFEYTALELLENTLLEDPRFKAQKTIVNEQATVKGSDLEILDTLNGNVISLECKLAAGKSVKVVSQRNRQNHCKVKVMRSRTLGDAMIARKAPSLGVLNSDLEAHRDSYYYTEFDIVVMNLRNAFYVTTDHNTFEFQPSSEEWELLENFYSSSDRDEIDRKLKISIFYAWSEDLTPSKLDIPCSRRNCGSSHCKFIPNYPIFSFDNTYPWRPLERLLPDLYSKYQIVPELD